MAWKISQFTAQIRPFGTTSWYSLWPGGSLWRYREYAGLVEWWTMKGERRQYSLHGGRSVRRWVFSFVRMPASHYRDLESLLILNKGSLAALPVALELLPHHPDFPAEYNDSFLVDIEGGRINARPESVRHKTLGYTGQVSFVTRSAS